LGGIKHDAIMNLGTGKLSGSCAHPTKKKIEG